MNKSRRETIANYIKHELDRGIHTWSPCDNKCGNDSRSHLCWRCWLDILVEGEDKSIENDGGIND